MNGPVSCMPGEQWIVGLSVKTLSSSSFSTLPFWQLSSHTGCYQEVLTLGVPSYSVYQPEISLPSPQDAIDHACMVSTR